MNQTQFKEFCADKDLVQREATYKKARQAHLRRWKGRRTQNWGHCTEIWLNPPKGT